MKHPLKSKTIWLAIVLAALGGILPVLQTADLPSWVLLIVSALVAGLRAVTGMPIGLGGGKPPAVTQGIVPTPTGEA